MNVDELLAAARGDDYARVQAALHDLDERTRARAWAKVEPEMEAIFDSSEPWGRALAIAVGLAPQSQWKQIIRRAPGVSRSRDLPGAETLAFHLGTILLGRDEAWNREAVQALLREGKGLGVGCGLATFAGHVWDERRQWRESIAPALSQACCHDPQFNGRTLEAFPTGLVLLAIQHVDLASGEPVRSLPICRPDVQSALATGRPDRDALIDIAIANLRVPHNKNILQSWLQLLKALSPTKDEREARFDAYVALCASELPGAAKLGLAEAKKAPANEIARAVADALDHPSIGVARAALALVRPLISTPDGLDVVTRAQASRHAEVRDAVTVAPAADTSPPTTELAEPALVEPGPHSPFLGERLDELATPGDVVDRFNAIAAGRGSVLDFELIFAGVLRFRDAGGGDEVRRAMGPIGACLDKWRRYNDNSMLVDAPWEQMIAVTLATAWQSPGCPPVLDGTFAGRALYCRAPEDLRRRAEHVAHLLEVGTVDRALATPTHVNGWLDPTAFADRLAGLDPKTVGAEDLAAALYRLHRDPDQRAAAWSRLSSLDLPATVVVALAPAAAARDARDSVLSAIQNRAVSTDRRDPWNRLVALTAALTSRGDIDADFGRRLPTDRFNADEIGTALLYLAPKAATHGSNYHVPGSGVVVDAARFVDPILQRNPHAARGLVEAAFARRRLFESWMKSDIAAALASAAARPEVVVADLLEELVDLMRSQTADHHDLALSLFGTFHREGRASADAIATQIATVLGETNKKGPRVACASWACTGPNAAGLVARSVELVLAAGASHLNHGSLTALLDLWLAYGSSLQAAALQTVRALAVAKKTSPAKTRAAAILARIN